MNYGEVLKNIGYNLTDRGSYWSTNALFRGGDNRTAIRIYKDSGVWCDFVEGNRSLPFEVLLKKTTGKTDVSDILNSIHQIIRTEKRLLKQETIFPESSLKKLLPDYDYFESRGINKLTQKAYKCGLATGGKLYQRIVFPIYRADKKIHGFSGRKVLQDNERPPWLHYGHSTDWFYPYYSVEGVIEKIKEEKRVFLVESIGDSMAMFQNEVENNLVCFSNKIGPKMISRLANLGVDIVFAFNDDSKKEGKAKDQGKRGALISILKLIDIVDLNRIWFVTPNKNDFGDMNSDDFKKWKGDLKFSEEYHLTWRQDMVSFASQANLPKNLEGKIKKLK